MTIASELAEASFDWTGVETSFACGFPARRKADVSARFINASGAEATLTRDLHFSVALASETRIVTVTPLALPPAPGRVTIRRDSVFKQAVVFEEGVAVASDTHELLHDDHVMRDQELRRDVAATRALLESLLAQAKLPTTSRGGALLALKGHETSGVNWLEAVQDAIPPAESDPANIAFADPFWPPSSIVWVYVFAALQAGVPGGFSGAALAALQNEAASLSPSFETSIGLIRRGQALLALKASASDAFPNWLSAVQDAVAEQEDETTNIYWREAFWPIAGYMWSLVASTLSLSSSELASLQARALAIP